MTQREHALVPVLLLSSLFGCGRVESDEGPGPTRGAAGERASDQESDRTPLETSCAPASGAPAIAAAIEGTADENGRVYPAAVTELDASDGGLLGVECLAGLEHLTVKGDLSEEDVSRLAGLESLISMGWSEVTSIAPLINVPHLRQLTLSSSSLQDLSPLEELSELEELRIYGTTSLGSLNAIGELQRLKLLSFFNVRLKEERTPDYSFLEKLTLETLDLALAEGVVDFADVSPVRLRKINLNGVASVHLERLGPPASAPGSIQFGLGAEGTSLDLLVDTLCPLDWCIETYGSTETGSPFRLAHCPSGCGSDSP